MSQFFISYSRKDSELVEKIVDALVDDDLQPWIDWKNIPKGEEVQKEIHQAIEESEIFLYFVSPDSVVSKWCIEEVEHAAKNNKRILPIIIRDVEEKVLHIEISKRNWMFCREGQEDFATSIGELRKTIHTDYEWLKYHTELQVKALKWEQGKDNSRLLRGRELREAEQKVIEIILQRDPQPTLLQRTYILSSQKNELRQRKNILLSLTMTTVVLITISAFAWTQRNSAIDSKENAIAEANARFTALANEASALATAQSEANARATAQANADEQQKAALAEQLNVQSVIKQESNYSTSLLLNIEAYRKNESSQARGLLLSNLFSASRLKAYLNGHTERVNDVVYSPDGNIIASASDDNSIILWDANAYVPIGLPLSGHTKWVTSLAFSPDGKLLVSAGLDNNIIFWDVETMQSVGEPLSGHKYRTDYVLFAPDGKYLLSIGCSEISGFCQKSQIIIWDVETRSQVSQPLQLTSGIVNCVEFNPDGTLLALCDGNSDVLLIEMKNLKVVNKFSANYNGDLFFAIGDVDFSPDGKTIAVGYYSSIILISVPDFQPVNMYLNGHTDQIKSVVFSPDGKTIISGGRDQQVVVWELDKQEPVEKMVGHTREVIDIDYNPNGSSFVTGGGDGKVIIWSSQAIEAFEKVKVAYPVYDLSISPTADILAFVGDNNVVSFLDLQTLELIGEVQIQGMINVNSVVFSHNGRILAVGGCAKEQVEGFCVQGDVVLIDVATFSIPDIRLSKHTREVKSLSFSPDDNWLASGGSDDKVVIWDVNTMRLIKVLSEHSDWVSSLDFSPDGRLLASGSYDDAVFFWETDTFSLVNQLEVKHDAWVTSLGFTPDGTKLVSSGWDGAIKIWDVNTQKLIGNPMKEFEWTEILSIAISPDGKILASGKTDKSISLWDIERQQMIGEPFTVHTYFVNSVVFSPDGKYLVSGGEDGRIVVWNIEPESIIDKTCLRVGRNFTQSEWQQYFPGEEYRLTCPQWTAGQ